MIGVDLGGSGVRATRFGGEHPWAGLPGATVERPLMEDGPVESIASAVAQLCSVSPSESEVQVRLGIAAPGHKTADGRGIDHATNLPRVPGLLDELSRVLRLKGVQGLELPGRLVSDSLAALLGETLVPGGLLAGEGEVLFLGPGTGLGEAKLSGGEVLPTSGTRAAELAPVQEEESCKNLEDEVSLGGLVGLWQRHAPDQASRALPIEEAARAGQAVACSLLSRFATALCEVIDHRRDDLASLRRAAGTRPPCLLIRTRRGKFFSEPAVNAIVVPPLLESARRHGVRLVIPVQPASPHAGCAGALALSLREAPPLS